MSTTPTSSDTEHRRSQVFRYVMRTVQCLQCALIAAIGMLTSACDRQTSPPAVAAEKGAAAETRAEAEKDAVVDRGVPLEKAVVAENVPIIANPTIWDGVYTEKQRRRGEAVYDSSCLHCHGSDLEGEEVVPDLAGEQFLKRWKRKRVGNLFEFIRTEMPPKLKDRLTPPEYADVIAYILSRNKAPVGQKALGSNFAALQAIRMGRL